MRIYIDESGAFAHSPAKSSISLVGSLAIPEVTHDRILRKYERLRSGFPQDHGEVKGRLLSENQVAKVIELLRRNEVLFEAVAIDLHQPTTTSIETHRNGQCAGLTATLTPAHHQNSHEFAWRLRHRLESMSMPLYVQSQLNFELVWTTLAHAMFYFSQRRPEVLGSFEWIIDAKGSHGITDWEDWWRTVMRPLFQARSVQTPFPMIEDGDYSQYPGADRPVPAYLISHFPNLAGESAFDPTAALANFRFTSQHEAGLELVDIVSNALRRAITGNLQESGWRELPGLMIHRRHQYVEILNFGPDKPQLPAHAQATLRKFMRGGRSMVAPRLR